LVKGTLHILLTKNGSFHIIYLSDYMLEIIRSIPKVRGNAYLFAGHHSGKPIYQPRFAFNKIKAQAKIPNAE